MTNVNQIITSPEELLINSYKEIFRNKIIKCLEDQLHKIYIYSGDGTGKYFFSKIIKKHFEEKGYTSESLLYINGLNISESNKIFEELLSSNFELNNKVIIWHRFDNFYRYKEKYFINDPKGKEDFFSQLISFFSIDSLGQKIILSGIKGIKSILDSINVDTPEFKFFSILQTHFYSIKLNPWEYNWEEIISDQLKFILQQFSFIDITQQDNLVEDILRLTGGHPALIDVVFNYLCQYERDYFGISIKADALKKLLEIHLLEFGLPKLQRQINYLKSNKPEAFNYLYNIANESYNRLNHSVNEIFLIDNAINYGLLYFDMLENEYRIPGEILKREILRYRNINSELEVRLNVLKESKGILAIIENGQKNEFVLKGKQFILFKELYDNKNMVISIDQLVKITGNKKYAIQSALKRLKEVVNNTKAGTLIRNVRGKGYIFQITRNLFPESH